MDEFKGPSLRTRLYLLVLLAFIPVGLLMFILSSYQQSGYNLLIEGFRQQVIEGGLISMDAWTHLNKKSDQAETADAETMNAQTADEEA